MVAELNGIEEKTGLIKQLEDELQKQLPQKSNVTAANIEELKQSIEANVNELEAKQDELSKASQDVSFKQLYEAVTRVQESSADQCPACQTPLTQVKINPFIHAETELKKLEHLGQIQEAVKTLLDDIASSLNKLSALINICCSHNQENNPLTAVQITDEKAATISWWKSLLQNLNDGSTSLKHFEKQVKQLEDAFFKNKQMILACHGEEFFKDIQNLLPAEQAGLSKTVSFLPKTGEHHICVDLNCSPRNYIIAARTHFDRSEIRDALDKSRKALESLAKGKVWRYVNRFGDGNLSIKMRSATAPIELRNLTEQLKSKIGKTDFSNQNKASVLEPIKSLLGIDGDSREWRYLNKGTHEEENRAEFDRQTVSKIVTALEEIDKALQVQRAQ